MYSAIDALLQQLLTCFPGKGFEHIEQKGKILRPNKELKFLRHQSKIKKEKYFKILLKLEY